MLRRTKHRQDGSLGEQVQLTVREFRLLCLYVGGAQHKEIADKLGIRPFTVAKYLDLLALGIGVIGRRQIFEWSRKPGALTMGEWVDWGGHAKDCPCVYCTAIRVSTDPDALAAYKEKRDQARKENAPDPAQPATK